ncbi:reverse transcriptase domain-containing protein [Tanacetum coccineum]
MKFPNVPSTSVKLMLFPFSLEGAARIWLEKEPPRSILTWDDLVSKFINKFFPPSKTTNLRNEITRFQQKFDETFYEAWDRFNDLLRGCPHHGFSELHQLDTFYNALNSNDQDSLNSAAGGNFLDKMPRECLKIIESKSKVRQSRSKAIVSKVSTSSSTPAVSSDVAELIVDFLNAQPIRYALTINPTIYVSCKEHSRLLAKKQRSRRSKRKDTEVPQPSGPTINVAYEAANEEMDDSLVRATTTATGLKAEQDNGSGPKRQKTMGDTIAQTRSENVSKLSNDPLLVRVLALETTKTTQAIEIASLKKVGSSGRVEPSEDKGLGEEDASKQGRIADINANKDIYLVNVQTDEDMFGVNDLDGDEVIVENVDVVKTTEETRSVVEEVTAVIIPVSAATTTTTTTAINDVEMTLAQALAELKSAKPKATTITTTPTLTTTTIATTITAVSTRPRAKGLVIHEQEQAPTPTVSSQQPSQVKAKIDADYQLAQRLQAQEQDEFTDA